MGRYRVSRKAQSDIRDIGQYTQQLWGREKRRAYLWGMDAAFRLLAANPLCAAERREFEPPVRIHRYEKHLIIYRAEPGGVFIIRVLHERMDIAAWLSGQ